MGSFRLKGFQPLPLDATSDNNVTIYQYPLKFHLILGMSVTRELGLYFLVRMSEIALRILQ